jgi:hypothetical protein
LKPEDLTVCEIDLSLGWRLEGALTGLDVTEPGGIAYCLIIVALGSW